LPSHADQEQMACLIETTHGVLLAFLLEHGWAVYPVNTRTVDRTRNAAGAKTDAMDASLFAKTGRADVADVHRLTPESEIVAERNTVTRDHDGLIHMQTRVVNQRIACLTDDDPVALHLFSQLQQKSTVLFLHASPTREKAMAASVEQMAHPWKHAGQSRAEAVAATIFETRHQPHVQANAVTTRPTSRLMLALVAHLVPLREQMAASDKEMERLFLSQEDNVVFSSLPRAGKRLAPRLLAELGDDASRSESAASLQALGGTSPVVCASGNSSKPHRRLGGMKPLRNALQHCAWQRTQEEPWANASSERKRADGNSQSVAVRALSHVWARIMFAMLGTHKASDRTTFETAKQLYASRAAEPSLVLRGTTACLFAFT